MLNAASIIIYISTKILQDSFKQKLLCFKYAHFFSDTKKIIFFQLFHSFKCSKNPLISSTHTNAALSDCFHIRKWQKQNFPLLTKNCLVNTNRKLFVKTAKPINQLRSVEISLCVEANIWTQERWGDQCSMSLPVFFLIPQDESVWASTPSLLFHASIWLLLSLSVSVFVSDSGHVYTPPSLPFFLSPSSLTL